MSMMDLMIPERSLEPREKYNPLYTCSCCGEAICEGEEAVRVDDWYFHQYCMEENPVKCMRVVAYSVDEFVARDDRGEWF